MTMGTNPGFPFGQQPPPSPYGYGPGGALPPPMPPAGLPALPGMGGPPVGLGGEPQQQTNVFKLVHNLFRGRYILTLGLSAGAAILGLTLGWLSRTPMYVSEATIRIQPMQQRVMRDTWDVTPMFASFVNTQVNLMTQDRTVSRAMSSPGWQAISPRLDDEARKEFEDSLNVRVPNREAMELIRVSFSHKDPEAAFRGVTEVCNAYYELHGENQGSEASKMRERILEDKRKAIEQRIKDAQDRIQQLARELGTDEPARLQDFMMSKRLAFAQDVEAIKAVLRSRGYKLPDEPGARKTADDEAIDVRPPEPKKPDEMTVQEIAAVDAGMATLIGRMQDAQMRKEQLLQNGFLENHTQVRRITADINATQKMMEQRRQDWIAGREAAPIAAGPNAGVSFATETTERLVQQLRDLQDQLDATFNESSELAGKAQQMDSLRATIEQERTNLRETMQIQEELRADRELWRQAGRIERYLPERAPSFPSNDSRLKWAVVFGALGGMLPIGIIGLYGLFDRRYRYSDEAIEEGPTNTTLLGILPRLPSDLNDAEQAMAAAHCVHQIRTLVQIGGRNRRVLAVTSSNPGDGKTSMTLALGLSYAGSGSKTLLVDLDLIGQGLSRSLRLREQDSLFRVLVNGDIHARVRKTHMNNLFLLPTGTEDDHRTANRLAEPQITRLLQTVASDYDVVLIDTGPVLGSIEAHLVCAQADGVILVVGAGRARGQVKAAVDQLRRVGARLMGLVFNMAQARDFRTSAASQSFRSIRPDGGTPQPPSPSEFPELETQPLARVVAIDTRGATPAPGPAATISDAPVDAEAPRGTNGVHAQPPQNHAGTNGATPRDNDLSKRVERLLSGDQ